MLITQISGLPRENFGSIQNQGRAGTGRIRLVRFLPNM
ncbi:hypothetical protein ASAP_0126 [Asaia bogorensis]|uniref:Uncharacterized protein n=1 Tax=Asaia bogorensis TaxID=91915 RepID=A0A060QG10_9PROT|nr:hypothetical protein P792_07035 [Asaia sp. SF2.1]CDG38171.1 hypothetical protein ASAP_0126 [Asaia bogorensis]